MRITKRMIDTAAKSIWVNDKMGGGIRPRGRGEPHTFEYSGSRELAEAVLHDVAAVAPGNDYEAGAEALHHVANQIENATSDPYENATAKAVAAAGGAGLLRDYAEAFEVLGESKRLHDDNHSELIAEARHQEQASRVVDVDRAELIGRLADALEGV